MTATIDREALKALLVLAAEGARTTNARLTERTSEAWSILARFATAPGDATISLAGPSSFLGASNGEWVTAAAAAEAMGVSGQHVRRLARRGAVVARKHGKVWMIDCDSAQNWRRAA